MNSQKTHIVRDLLATLVGFLVEFNDRHQPGIYGAQRSNRF
jgi:hypothetical protein